MAATYYTLYIRITQDAYGTMQYLTMLHMQITCNTPHIVSTAYLTHTERTSYIPSPHIYPMSTYYVPHTINTKQATHIFCTHS